MSVDKALIITYNLKISTVLTKNFWRKIWRKQRR